MKGDWQKIVDELGIDETVALIREAMGPELLDTFELLGVNTESRIRYSLLAARFEKGRVALDMTIKDVAALLKVPQYRLKAVEEGDFNLIVPGIFRRYCRFLELDETVESWVRENAALAGELGIGDE